MKCVITYLLGIVHARIGRDVLNHVKCVFKSPLATQFVN